MVHTGQSAQFGLPENGHPLNCTALELHFLKSFDEYGRNRAMEDTTLLPEAGLQDGDLRGGTDAGS